MTKNHLKRIRIPKTWSLKKKLHVFSPRPNPGAHSMEMSVPLILVLRDMLGYVETKREAVKVLHDKNVLVNQKRRKDIKHQIGLMDTISLEEVNEHYRVMIDAKGKLFLNKTTKERTQVRPAKIMKKNSVKGGKTQLTFTDGTTMLVGKEDYKVGDTLMLQGGKKITEHLKIAPGNYVYFTKGKQVGNSGVIENISDDKIIFKQKDGTRQETSKIYAFVVGKDKPMILLPELKK